jgi:predicted RNA binding protein YcfA (HicA-like mRNA interferase family)
VEGNKIDHPLLIQEKRARMKILLLDPTKDIPVKVVNAILKEAVSFY